MENTSVENHCTITLNVYRQSYLLIPVLDSYAAMEYEAKEHIGRLTYDKCERILVFYFPKYNRGITILLDKSMYLIDWDFKKNKINKISQPGSLDDLIETVRTLS